MKKGQECPGYTLRLQWSTKYERPREPARPEPTNFDQLVSAVTQSIVPNASPGSSNSPGQPATPATPATSDSLSTARARRPGHVTATPPTSGSVIGSPFPAAPSMDSVPPHYLHSGPHPDYTASLGLAGIGHHVDMDSGSTWGGDTSVCGDTLWGHSRGGSVSPRPPRLDSLVELVASGDVDEPESSLSGTEAELVVRQSPPPSFQGRFGYIVAPAPQLTRPLVDIPSFLIQHWFKTVCTSWSAFDSHVNPYRQLSASLWNSSMAVFYALQSMAAASLVEHLPHLKDFAREAPRLATQAISYEFRSFRANCKSQTQFPGGLVLSLFCMSSSICWTDSRQFGLQFLKPGRAVLNCLNKYADSLSSSDRELLNFFNGCLIYEEMLRSIVSNDETDMENLASWQVSPTQTISVEPHAWTGVSPDLLRLFGKTMFLCRRSRNRWRGDEPVAEKLFKEALDCQEASAIEEVLLATELPDLPHSQDISEEAALKRHLHDAAEAYRLSSLLQLYQTFPNLIARRLPDQVDANGLVPYSGWLSPLALHITSILRNIPPSSSMRCLQPLLCLCAATGLRYDVAESMMERQSHHFAASSSHLTPMVGLANLAATVMPGSFGLSASAIGAHELEIASGRRFLMERLSRLEQNLPPKPIQVEKELLKSIWTAYDAEIQTTCKTHWLDVMVNNGLESVFG